jgi:hypothetical protein
VNPLPTTTTTAPPVNVTQEQQQLTQNAAPGVTNGNG